MRKTSDPQTATPRIVVRDVHKSFRLRHTHSIKETVIAALRRKPVSTSLHALDGLSFDIAEGESVALLGFNGSGKSTTLKMISGVLQPDKGEALTRGRVAGLIEVGAGFHPDLSGRENIYLNAAILGMTKKETDERFDEIVAFSEIEAFIDTEVKHYSSGMFLRLAFSVAIHTEVDILLIDEILSVGDEPFQKKCIARIRQLHASGKTLVVVSHDLNMITRLCERGIVIQDGKVAFDGPSSEAVRALRKLSRSPFTDVPRDHEYFDQIVETVDSLVLPSYPQPGGDQEFRPDEPVATGALVRAIDTLLGTAADPALADAEDLPLSRAALAREFYRIAGSPPAPPHSPFGDVAETHPDVGAIAWLHAEGIARGWGSASDLPTYRPDSRVTRDAFVIFLARFREVLAAQG